MAEFQSEQELEVMGVSPDGRYAYVSQVQDGGRALRTLDLDGLTLVGGSHVPIGTGYMGSFADGILLVEVPED